MWRPPLHPVLNGSFVATAKSTYAKFFSSSNPPILWHLLVTFARLTKKRTSSVGFEIEPFEVVSFDIEAECGKSSSSNSGLN